MPKNGAPARITIGELDRCTLVNPRSALRRVLDFIVSTIIFRNEDAVARRYQGSAWCDLIEHDLNDDIMTRRRTRL